MKTLLIPVDFSATSANVLRYAADLAREVQAERILLLKSHYTALYAQLLPSADFIQLSADELEEERRRMEKQLAFIAHKLLKKCNSTIQVQTAISELPLLRAVNELIAQESPDLLLTGSDGTGHPSSATGELVIGLAKTSTVPVLIVPAGARYEPIKRALLPCDFSAVSRLALLKELRSTRLGLHPELLVLNIDPEQKHLVQGEEQTASLKKLLKSYRYRVYYAADRNIVHGLLDFAGTHDVQLIVALPGRYSFFYHLTHRSITDGLALNGKHPVLVLK